MTRHQRLMVDVQDEDSVLCHEDVTFPRIDGVFSKLAFRSSSPSPVGREVLKTRSSLTQGLSACPADASDWRSIRLCLSILSQRFLHQSFPRLLGAGQRGKTHKPAPFRGGSLTKNLLCTSNIVSLTNRQSSEDVSILQKFTDGAPVFVPIIGQDRVVVPRFKQDEFLERTCSPVVVALRMRPMNQMIVERM